jgi:hypothetical protein
MNQKVRCYVAPSLIAHLQSIPYEDQIIYPSKVQWGQTHRSAGTTSIGGVMHTMCQPLKHLSHTNIWATPPLDPHNIHLKLTRITAKLGSTVPSTFGRWHGAQLRTWSFQTTPPRPSNMRNPEANTYRIRKIVRPAVTSNVVNAVYCK